MVETGGLPVAPPGFLVVYTDGSSAEEGPGVSFAGFGVWLGRGDVRNYTLPLAGHVRRTIEPSPRHLFRYAGLSRHSRIWKCAATASIVLMG